MTTITFAYAVLSVYIIFTIIFTYGFFKNGFNINKTIKWFKSLAGRCCVKGKRDLEKKIDPEKLKEIEEELMKLDDCKMPVEKLPLDLCLSSDLEKEEVELRQRVLEILKERDNVVEDGGVKKLVLPMEATIFLTKGYDPIVNEEGEILILIRHEDVPLDPDHEEMLRKIRIFLGEGDGERCIYEDPQEIIDMILEAHKKILEKQKQKMGIEDNDTEGTPPSPEEPVKPVAVKSSKSLTDDIDNSESLDKDILAEILEHPEDHDIGIDDLMETNSITPAESQDEVPLASIDDLVETEEESELSLHDLIEESAEEDVTFIGDDSFAFDEEDLESAESVDDEKSDPVRDFYDRINFISIDNPPSITKENIIDAVTSIIESRPEELRTAVMNNLVKTRPLVFTKNKDAVFVDMNNIFAAFAKAFGLESSNIIKIIESMNLSRKIKLQNAFNELLSPVLLNEDDRYKKTTIKRGENEFFAFGLMLKTSSFQNVLKDSDYDFFRSLPYSNEYSISYEQTRSKAPLSSSPTDTLI